VRPAEPGWAGPSAMPDELITSLPKVGRAPNAPSAPHDAVPVAGQDRDSYADAIRDWAAKGAASEYVLTRARSWRGRKDRPVTKSAGAAHFELANHLWRSGPSRARHRALRREPPTAARQTGPTSAGVVTRRNERFGGPFGSWVQSRCQWRRTIMAYDSDESPRPVDSSPPATTPRRYYLEDDVDVPPSGAGPSQHAWLRRAPDRRLGLLAAPSGRWSLYTRLVNAAEPVVRCHTRATYSDRA
jgi:hypothetical protein